MRVVLRLQCPRGAAPGGAGQSLAVLVVRVVIVGAVCLLLPLDLPVVLVFILLLLAATATAPLAAFQEGPAQEEAVPEAAQRHGYLSWVGSSVHALCVRQYDTSCFSKRGEASRGRKTKTSKTCQ